MMNDDESYGQFTWSPDSSIMRDLHNIGIVKSENGYWPCYCEHSLNQKSLGNHVVITDNYLRFYHLNEMFS